MKKLFTILIITFSLVSVFSVSTYALNGDAEIISESGGDEVFEGLSEEARDLLESIGITEISFDSVFSVTPSSVFGLVKKLITGGIEAPAKSLVRLLTVIILISVCECFMPDSTSLKSVCETAGVLFCIISILSPLSTAVSSAVASISVNGAFMKGLIPTLAAVITASGNPLLALSFRSIAFSAAEVISAIAEKCIAPLVGAVLSMDIIGGIMPSFKLNSLTDIIKKTLIAAMSLSATLFVAFLGIKEALANAADTVASRGIKLAISTAVPVVGGALSELYNGVMGSIVLARSTLGIFGIAAISLINLPSCIQLLFWIFALRVGSAVGELFSQRCTADLLRAMASAVTLLNVVLLFNGVIFIVSTALILLVKAG